MENGFEWPGLLSALVLAQHPDQHGPERPVLLAVDQQLGEGAGLGLPPVRADPVGAGRLDGRQGPGLRSSILDASNTSIDGLSPD